MTNLHLLMNYSLDSFLAVDAGSSSQANSLHSRATLVDVPIVRMKMAQDSHLLGRRLQSVVASPCRALLVLSHLVNHKTQRSNDHGSGSRGVQAVADAIPRARVGVDITPSGSD